MAFFIALLLLIPTSAWPAEKPRWLLQWAARAAPHCAGWFLHRGLEPRDAVLALKQRLSETDAGLAFLDGLSPVQATLLKSIQGISKDENGILAFLDDYNGSPDFFTLRLQDSVALVRIAWSGAFELDAMLRGIRPKLKAPLWNEVAEKWRTMQHFGWTARPSFIRLTNREIPDSAELSQALAPYSIDYSARVIWVRMAPGGDPFPMVAARAILEADGRRRPELLELGDLYTQLVREAPQYRSKAYDAWFR